MAYPATTDALRNDLVDGEDAGDGTPGSTAEGLHAGHHNDLATALKDARAELGDNPAGAAPTVEVRLDGIETSLAAKAASSDLTKVTANTQTDNYTLVLSDAGKAVEINAATAKAVTVPPNSSVAFPVGTVIELHRYGAGAVSVAAGAGVTIRSPGAKLKLASQYSSASLRKRATDEWVLAGDLSA